jgi:hypothetical protein
MEWKEPVWNKRADRHVLLPDPVQGASGHAKDDACQMMQRAPALIPVKRKNKNPPTGGFFVESAPLSVRGRP